MANFATLDSLKKGDEEKEKKGNAYYAGGARGAGRGGRCVCSKKDGQDYRHLNFFKIGLIIDM